MIVSKGMQLIWYNSIERKYEFGTAGDFHSSQSSSPHSEAYSILMEFSDEDGTMANRVIRELNSNLGSQTDRPTIH